MLHWGQSASLNTCWDRIVAVESSVFETCHDQLCFSSKTLSIPYLTMSSTSCSIWMLCGDGLTDGSWFARGDGLVGLESSVIVDELSNGQPVYLVQQFLL